MLIRTNTKTTLLNQKKRFQDAEVRLRDRARTDTRHLVMLFAGVFGLVSAGLTIFHFWK